ncbi:Choline dehydrogenase [Dethiosulfatibacter aminovorans DSM 17477]|uniref:Choline dehydrogenase n=1 Tax=Dethiosulfatibacter aminovorans DSM 17477 TaxID=1121476 RepID=A0A1M6KZG9_9FIRM|nr:GMC family oxidoreductase [Dethiosulfatibacter aminovorans]SHJ64385.1 Choline dehydrogenase [Dethiosulfatibacter aminovorans DSM 17477]
MKSHDVAFDYIIVGSGTGGATLARELSLKNKKVLVIEKGKHEGSYGKFKDAIRFFDHNKLLLPVKSKEGIIIWRGIMAGGSGFVATGNFNRGMEDEFRELGIDLKEEFVEAEKEIKVAPMSERLLSPGGRAIRKAASELGYDMELMPKGIDPKKCIKCGNCSLGCTSGAKWTPLVYLEEAVANGAEVWYDTAVKKVIEENGSANGVVAVKGNKEILVKGNKIILAAGGVGTPVILNASGIRNAGSNLFIDTFVIVYGKHEAFNLVHEPQMSLVYLKSHSEGFILSPHVNHPRPVKFMEAGVKGFMMNDKRTLGIMVKISDEPVGRVYENGKVSKKATNKDRDKIHKGSKMAREILEKTGVEYRNIIVTEPSGAHPGGTAAMGKIVDTNFETKIGNLFVCDASVFPTSPGLPPMLTIIALAKKLAKKLV